MKYILQIFTGPWHKAYYQPEEIIRKIREISCRIPVDKVIIGWNTDPSVYKTIGAFLHKAGTEMLLWLPVFAETGEVSEPEEALDLYGKRIESPANDEGADFIFCCPSSRRNIQAPGKIYDQYFSDCGFDGVFLDRIRSQSFASGISGVLSCGCERCRKAFLDRGVDIDAVRKLYEQKRDHFFDMAVCPANGEFELAEEQAQRFFKAREEIIADAVNEISRQFKEKGLIVGLDLFAPFVSRIAGQNYSLIAENADFIKPMLYRKTDAPAGIGYEFSAFEKHVPAARGRMKFSMDRAFLNTQLQAASRVLCEKYPGIEINYDETVARTDSGYITESLKAIKDYAPEGVTLCWNIMQVPETHIDAIAGLIETDDWIGLITERIRKVLGDNMTGVYLHGSAAMGCYNPAGSDLDLIVVVRDSPDDASKRTFMDMITELHTQICRKNSGHSGIEISIVRRDVCNPFTYPTPFELHFSAMHSEWYQRDPDDYIRKMKGTDKDLAAHITVLRCRGRCLCGEAIDTVFGDVPAGDYLDSIREDIAGAREEIAGNTMYFTLNLARTLAYRTTKTVLSKKEGGEWGLRNLPERFHPLIRTALEDYEGSAGSRYDQKLAEEYADYMLCRIMEKE